MTDTVKRRLYTLYPTQIEQLQRLAKHSEISQSEYLRQLITVEYVRKFGPETAYTNPDGN